MKWAKKQLWFLARFAGYFTINAAWGLMLRHVCTWLNKAGFPLFGFIFLVYPGTERQSRGYVPLWYRNIAPMLSVLGIVSKKKNGQRGLVITIPWMIHEAVLEDRLERILVEVERLARAIGVKSVALAGRLPGVISQNGLSEKLVRPFVAGDKGTVYTILLSVRQAAKSARLDISKTTIGILGYGFIGRRLVNVLQQEGFPSVICVDPAIKTERESSRLIISRDPAKLANCQMVVILTARGEQAETAVVHLRKDVILIDDTHPSLPNKIGNPIKENGGQVIKATLGLHGMTFFPRLPRWNADWLPGCCVEALVSARLGFADNQEDFNAKADQLGFVALEVTNRSEL